MTTDKMSSNLLFSLSYSFITPLFKLKIMELDPCRMRIKKRTKTLADGTIKTYLQQVPRTGDKKAYHLTPEQITDIKNLNAIGVKQKVICEKYDIYHGLFKKIIAGEYDA
jgi:hypothetical protein